VYFSVNTKLLIDEFIDEIFICHGGGNDFLNILCVMVVSNLEK
jgi:hypothetical protein